MFLHLVRKFSKISMNNKEDAVGMVSLCLRSLPVVMTSVPLKNYLDTMFARHTLGVTVVGIIYSDDGGIVVTV